MGNLYIVMNIRQNSIKFILGTIGIIENSIKGFFKEFNIIFF